MINEFSQIVEIIEDLDKQNMILKAADIREQKENIIDFAREKKNLILLMTKLQTLAPHVIEVVTPNKATDHVGPTTIILLDIRGELMNYKWQFFTMAAFIKPIVKFYRRKARTVACLNEKFTSNPILLHTTISPFHSEVDELKHLIIVIDNLNNDLGEKRILTNQDLHDGYRTVQELSAMSIDIQEILDKLRGIDPIDLCAIDHLLRTLFGKISKSCEYISIIIDQVMRKMISHYPDWNDDFGQ